jgi:hypothetical protein
MVIALILIVVYGCTVLLLGRIGFLDLDEGRLLRLGVLTCVLPAPYIIYLLVSFTYDPFLSGWTAQNIILSPHPFHYVLAFLVVIIPAVAGGWLVLQKRSMRGILLLVWVSLLPVLAYAPYNLQRRLPDGVWIALVALGMIGISMWSIKDRRIRWAGLLMVMLVIPSSILLLLGALTSATQLETPVFQSQEQVAAFNWINEHLESDAVVLAAYETGNPLPAWAYVRVPAGHGPESVKLGEVLPEIEDFYSTQSGWTEQDRGNMISTMGVTAVFHGPNERALGDWEPAEAPYLTEVYRLKDFAVYLVSEDFRKPIP